jgi:hypothetical protein
MNPEYLWLVDALQFLAVFVVGPALAITIAYSAWRGKPHNFTAGRYGIVCLASGITASLLFVVAKWMNADVRTVQFLVQFACVLVGGLLFGVFMGCGFPVLLRFWHWHKATRLPR